MVRWAWMVALPVFFCPGGGEVSEGLEETMGG